MKKITTLILSFIAIISMTTSGVFANPTGGSVVAGQATINYGSDVTINQSSNRAIINWQGFSISQGELTKFMQPGASSAVLNRVVGGNLSSILGTLQANGQVYLINPNGIVVGPSGVIDTQGFVGSTLDVTNDSFLSGGDMTFLGDSSAKIQNLGEVKGGMGDVFLIARQIENEGTIQGNTVGLAAGTEVLLQPVSGGIAVQAGKATGGIGIDNQGLIEATTAKLEAAGGNVYALAINNGGIISANSMVKEGGKIYLRSDGGKISNSGTLQANGATQGGSIEVTAGDIFISDSAELRADATVDGDGGSVTVIADDTSEFHGLISAKGAGNGDGGFAEVSGAHVNISGLADLSAPNGNAGEFLIDPGTVHLIHDAALLSGLDTFSDAWITSQLGSSNLTIQTSAATGANGADEDIIIFGTADAGGAVNINWSTKNRLTLDAGRSIEMHAGASIVNTSTHPGGQAIVMKANQGGSTSGNFGGINIDGATLQTDTLDIALTGHGGDTGSDNYGVHITNDAVVQTNEGDVSVTGNGGGDAAGNLNHGVYVDQGATIQTVDGKIHLKGTSGNGSDGHGVHLRNSALVTSVNGNIKLTGTGGTGYSNAGVYVGRGSEVSSTGTGNDAAKILIEGTGGSSDLGRNDGVLIWGLDEDTAAPGKITSIDGDINIVGQGGNGGNSYGVTLGRSSYVESLGTGEDAANIRIYGTGGTGGTGSDSNEGIWINDTHIASIDGAIILKGTGGSSSDSMGNSGIHMHNGAQVYSTGDANVDLRGVGGANGTKLNHGVHIEDAGTEVSAVNGKLVIKGTGGGSSASRYNEGVHIEDEAKVQSLGTGADAANIFISGTGGNGTEADHGVRITDEAEVVTVDGRIHLKGRGGASASSTHNYGVLVDEYGKVASEMGTGKIYLEGTGGSGEEHNAGVHVRNYGVVASMWGDITFRGWGGSGFSGNGVYVGRGGEVNSTGVGADAANIIFIGTGGSDDEGNNYGVLVFGRDDATDTDPGKVTTIDGDIWIFGQGGGGENSHGVAVGNSSYIESTGTGADAGNIRLYGTGGFGSTGTLSSNGIWIYDTHISSVDGNIHLKGTGGSSSVMGNSGILMKGGAQVYSIGNAQVDLRGTGGANGTKLNYGVHMKDSDTLVSAVNGRIVIKGTGGGSASSRYNDGVHIENDAKVESDEADVFISGTGGNGTKKEIGVNIVSAEVVSNNGGIDIKGRGGSAGTERNYGVLLNNAHVASNDSNIILRGTGGNGSGEKNIGVWVYESNVESVGIGNITLHGWGGSGTLENFGVMISEGSSSVMTHEGDLEVVGFGGGDGTDISNMGIWVYAAQIGSNSIGNVTLQGTGGNGTDHNYGVLVEAAEVTSDGGNIDVTGLGNGTGDYNIGVWLHNGVNMTTCDSGTITLIGTGANGGSNNYGVYTNSIAVNEVTTENGNLTVIGRGGDGTGSDNYGVAIVEGLIGSENGDVTVTGTGGNGTMYNHGVVFSSEYTTVGTADAGNLYVYGQGQGTDGHNFGIYMLDGAMAGSLNAGNVTMYGTGAGDATSSYGFYLEGTGTNVTTQSGDIYIEGTGGSDMTPFVGYYYDDVNSIQSTTGTVTLIGNP